MTPERFTSMGPRSCDRGWFVIALVEDHEGTLLQWGRGRVTADGMCLWDNRRAKLILQWGRGRVTADG